MMIEIVDQWAKSVPENKEIDFTIEANRLSFRIITRILFGRDIDKMGKWAYICPKDKTVSYLNYEDWYFKYSKDGLEAHYLLKGKILPFTYNHNLIEPFYTNFKNKWAMNMKLKDFLTAYYH